MTQYVHLIGTEQVQSAANTMREAANTMHRAANEIAYALQKHTEMMREFMDRLTNEKQQL